jgi:3-phosphoshikimate 1-carboxyvinyltransferase
MNWCKISPPLDVPRSVSIDLPLSKSIYNRLLIIRALSKMALSLPSEPLALDSIDLKAALDSYHSGAKVINSGEGGTSFRFLLAFLACDGFEGTLSASGTMIKRPISPLVQALNALGARLTIKKSKDKLAVDIGKAKISGGDLQIDASQSSQFISALLLVGPYLPKGLKIYLSSPRVSASYIEMTIQLMGRLGAQIEVSDVFIKVYPGKYIVSSSLPIQVERDWSAASYFWMHRFALPVEKITLSGLHENSIQGDAVIMEWCKAQGVISYVDLSGWVIDKRGSPEAYFGSHFDGRNFPDLAMTHLSLYAFLGYAITYTGLSTLVNKESHRIHALQAEWAKAGVDMQYNPPGEVLLKSSPRPDRITDTTPLRIHTHGDHRMAMCLSILAARQTIWIENPDVVRKSFPNYWTELSKLGYRIEVNISPEF